MISKEGEVGFFDAGGSRMEEVKIGGLIPRTYTIVTGANSQMVGLLSNGTLITLVEKTRMRVQTFQQEPFDPQGKKLKDLKEEPSGSKVELELDMGSLIVSTKKLDRQSSFDINSPLGTAGIRGTEFQMALDPSQGVQLDVTESTVAFSPPGGGQPIAVSEGSGLSVTPTGTVTQRPVNPTAAQRISNTNQAATASSENISLNDVTTAMEQATTEAETMLEESPETMEDSSEEPKEEETQPEREEEAPMEEEAPSGDTDEPSSEPSEEPVPVEESSEPAAGEVDDAEPQSGDSEPQAEAETETTGSTSADGGEGGTTNDSTETANSTPAPASETEVADAESGGQVSSSSGESSTMDSAPKAEAPAAESGSVGSVEPVATSPVVAEAGMDKGTVQNAALENNSEISMARKTGKVDQYTKALSKFGLSEEQTLRFYELGENAKSNLLVEKSENVGRLLSIKDFGPETADLFFAYSPGTREKILGLEDGAMVALIHQGIDEILLSESLTKMNLERSNSSNVPAAPANPDPLEARKLALGESLIANNNERLLEEWTELAGDDLSEDWLEIGEMAARILQDQTLDGTELVEILQNREVLGNPFYAELADLYDQLELDLLVAGESPMIATKNLVVTANSQALSPYFGDGASSLILSASEDLDIAGDLNWESPSQEKVRLVMMGAGNLRIQPGSNLNSATSDLVISTREHLSIEQVKLEVAQELAIRSLRDLELKNVTVGADALATIKARRDLNVDGLSFNRQVSRIVMEATTMRLSNIDFPALSTVQLNSLKGGIDGKYPNFGSSIPAAEQIGRVNFIENIRSGGNLIMDRVNFDQFGRNISIGKIGRP